MEQRKKITKISYLRYVFALALRQRQSIVFLAILLFIGVGARLTEPYLYKVVVDTLTNGLVAKNFVSAQMQTLVVAVAVWFTLAIIVNTTSAQASFLVWHIGNHSSQKNQHRRLPTTAPA